MAAIADLQHQLHLAMEATRNGRPRPTSNVFFGVGPITDGTLGEADARLTRFAFEAWLEQTYRKLDDKGRDVGPFTTAEIGRSMHRGYPADKILQHMMREIHRYFEFPKTNKMAVGLGGGHSGFTVCALHLMSAHDPAQQVYVDTLRPESDAAAGGGFFRQSWGTQLIEMQRFAKGGDETRIHFADVEGHIPAPAELLQKGIKIIVGVGHETTGATTYTDADIDNLLAWLDANPDEHHAMLDATSMLGAMPWAQDKVRQVMAKCCLFMPFQKAIGGISGYFVASFTPQALALVERNQKTPSWAIPRQLKIAAPTDPKKPLSGERTVNVGPIYDPEQDKMLGGVINTYSTLAFAETTFGLLRSEATIGDVTAMNRRSVANRAAINEWVAQHPLFALSVKEPERRGAAVTLLRVNDAGITDAGLHNRIIARSKQILAYEGVTHPNGDYEPGLDVARYVNAFPGTPGDYRCWIGGIRQVEDITALLDNLAYAYSRAKVLVLEEELAAQGITFPASATRNANARMDDPERAYKVLIADLVGMTSDAAGKPDASAVRAHIEAKGGAFHVGGFNGADLAKGTIHFFYEPHLSTESDLLEAAGQGQYDALVAAATFIPKECIFPLGGVRIGAGTGNMGSSSWGGGNGIGGGAPLMNTPSFNSRATAQMAMKALLKVLPDLDVATLHARVTQRDFDTGRHLRDFPTEKLEGKTIAILGYGNIGREVAKLAQAFGMKVKIHAREAHRGWIESEGFTYAATAENAAQGADVLSIHTGLGKLDPTTKRFSNQGFVNAAILNALNDGAVLINYDRGEIVDVAALDAALMSGKIRHAAIDADLFTHPETGAASGPMATYLPLLERHATKLELLPHAAADTDHPSRVEGAKQAVDQIFDVIRFRRVTNLVGDLPEGFANAGARTVSGVGKVRAAQLAALDQQAIAEARGQAETMAAIWGALATVTNEGRRAELIERHGAELMKAINGYKALTDKLGLQGPYG
ncbi:NAD(P)-dependent oxidoreductase [Methylovirgula sp. 4M-Z18]|uniref:NAD(P)-dependent oxidoreductase n=1 Tax=Methylovirgula sp. 4M-Z18 TaxID=2293567 RepID=UPI000E2F919C|nr:NAD(P)-dependent oxidoreductase [Methylovirgula sp. 4M-Z18]RFB79988.1 phosphoglycerate dehydrogenase [Methylovirgula sp. 4M-Z18]